MTKDKIVNLVNGIENMHDLCLLQVGIFCGSPASKGMGRGGSLGRLKEQGCAFKEARGKGGHITIN
jgi:hypothetical protein